MVLSQQNAASATSLGPIVTSLQQPVVRWLLIAGLGTGSLILATRFSPLLFRPSPPQPKTVERPPSPTVAPSSASEVKKERQKENTEHVAIFWDVDNCAPPTGSSGRSVALAVRSSIQKLNAGPIVSFKAYLELSSETSVPNAAQVQLRSELQGCGVSLIDTPKSGRKDVADKMMITDLLAFAIDQPAPATIVLISGDRDFAYPLGILRNRGYEVVLIVPPIGAVPILEASANVVLTWRQDVLGIERNAAGKPYNTYANHHGPSTPSKPFHALHTTPSSNAQSLTPSSLHKKDRRPSVQSMEIFGSLIHLLEQMRKEGLPKPLRSAVAARLYSSDPMVYSRAGADRWADFSAVAEAANIVTLGASGGPGTEWVSLKDTARSASKAAATSLPLTSTPIRNKPSVPATTPLSASSTSKAVDLKPFYPLIEVCKEFIWQGNATPLSSAVATQIVLMERKGSVDAYALAKVSNWAEYIAAAERAGVAKLVPTEIAGVTAVSLSSKFLPVNAKSTPLKPTAPVENIRQNGAKAQDTDIDSKPVPEAKVPTSTAKRTVVANGHEIPQIFGPLADILLKEMAEGRAYSTDFFCHQYVEHYRSPNYKISVKSVEDFRQYAEAAVICKIITSEPGHKPGVRHLRLHPRLVKPGPKKAVTSSQSTIVSEPALSGKVTADKAERIETLRKEAGETLAALNRSSSSEGYNASGKIPADDRFAPLIDSIDAILKHAANDESSWKAIESGISKTKLSAELTRRHTGAGGLGGFYQSLGSTGFTDYLTQANEKGLVVVTDKEGQIVPKTTSLIGLSEYTVELS